MLLINHQTHEGNRALKEKNEQHTEVLVDRIQNSQKILGRMENIRLHISKSPATNEWRSSPSETENSNNIRFPDFQSKIFKLHKKKDLSTFVKRY